MRDPCPEIVSQQEVSKKPGNGRQRLVPVTHPGDADGTKPT
jgi:hypothetical protein